MNLASLLPALLVAYVFGSIPTAVWLGRGTYQVDIRKYGSKNAGATNAFRVLGKRAGATVMLIDMFKGWAATNLVYIMGHSATGSPGSIPFINYQLTLGLAAVLGHLFPVFANFKGGKGVATLFGMLVAVHPQAALLCALVFFTLLLLFRYVSLSSIVAGFTFPLSIIFVFHSPIRSFLLYGLCFCVLILITHQKNIERLLRGQESKVHLFNKR